MPPFKLMQGQGWVNRPRNKFGVTVCVVVAAATWGIEVAVALCCIEVPVCVEVPVCGVVPVCVMVAVATKCQFASGGAG